MTERFEVVFEADADITSGPTFDAQQAAKAEQQETTEGDQPTETEETP